MSDRMILTIREIIDWLKWGKVMNKDQLDSLRELNNEIVNCLMYNVGDKDE